MKLIDVKRTSKTPWEESESRFDIQKSFIPVSGRWEDSYDPIQASFVIFFYLLEISLLLETENSKNYSLNVMGL